MKKLLASSLFLVTLTSNATFDNIQECKNRIMASPSMQVTIMSEFESAAKSTIVKMMQEKEIEFSEEDISISDLTVKNERSLSKNLVMRGKVSVKTQKGSNLVLGNKTTEAFDTYIRVSSSMERDNEGIPLNTMVDCSVDVNSRFWLMNATHGFYSLGFENIKVSIDSL